MLAKLNVQYVIVGHSERRQLFGETDESVNLKLKAVLKHGMTPIVCVGETLEEREAGAHRRRGSTSQTACRVRRGQGRRRAERAWSPTSRSGRSGPAATRRPRTRTTTIGVIRGVVRDLYGGDRRGVRIQYGGSVKPGNIAELMAMPEIDGALVGGASLDPDEFAAHRPLTAATLADR